MDLSGRTLRCLCYRSDRSDESEAVLAATPDTTQLRAERVLLVWIRPRESPGLLAVVHRIERRNAIVRQYSRLMKHLLLIDDDATLTRTYRDRLSAHGFRVNTAGNAATALSLLRSTKPDLVVLDLILPDLSGIELLRFMRQEPRLAPTPVVVLTNNYGSGFGRQAANLGIEKAFLKAECSPSVLMAAIDEMLNPGLAAARPLEPLADLGTSCAPPPAEPVLAARLEDAAQNGIEAPMLREEPVVPEEPLLTEQSGLEEGARLLDDAPSICADLSEEFEALSRAPGAGPEQQDHLQELFYRVHVLAVTVRQTEFALLAQTTAAFDALLNALSENPNRLSLAVLRTVGSLVEVVRLLFQRARESAPGATLGTCVLVVDDDPLANRMVVDVLRQAQVDACSTEDSLEAWQWINRKHFDLVLLGIEMPVLDGWELCERLRMVPGYEKTPVIFVTAHDDPDTHSRSTLSGADDLVVKPFLAQEMAAKVLIHLVRAQIQA